MNPNDILSTLKLLGEGVKNSKEILATIPTWMFLPPNREKLVKLQDQVSSLENRLSSGLPQIGQLIRLYANVLSEVKVAKSTSDKVAELLGIDGFNIHYLSFFINNIETEFGNISSGVRTLPVIDSNEAGALEQELSIIHDLIKDLKRETSRGNVEVMKRNFDDVSTHYTKAQTILTGLLKKILASFEP